MFISDGACEAKELYKRRIALICAAVLTAVVMLLVFGVREAYADTMKYRLVTKTKLAVREMPDASSKKLGKIKKKKKITATKLIDKKWYCIKYKGKVAYITKKGTTKRLTIRKYSPKKTLEITKKVSIRASYSKKSKKIKVFKKGTQFVATGLYTVSKNNKWYSFKYNNMTVFVPSGYAKTAEVTVPDGDSGSLDSVSGAEYKKALAEAGFPASYQSKLAYLHELHPKWVFKAVVTPYTWSTLNSKARVVGRNLIDSNVSVKWRSKASSVYNSKTKKWTTFDGGRWYQATDAVIAYYLDPRNFLNTNSIYQFMDHRYTAASQTKAMLKKMVASVSYCFLNTTEYVDTIFTAGKAGKVNPNVLAAMIIEEQGWRGTSDLISGNVKGYKGYYNFFNIGAYTANGMSAVQRGLWYAKGSGTNATTYGRPWNSKYKAILGGALFYSETYVNKNQFNYYSKKFNVFNGASSVGTHEYMTNVMGAEEEGSIVKRAYKGAENRKIIFYIPVYRDMPASPCAKPAT